MYQNYYQSIIYPSTSYEYNLNVTFLHNEVIINDIISCPPEILLSIDD